MSGGPDEFQNPYWHQLARSTPRLSDQARVDRQEVRGNLWFVLRDSLSGRQVRLTPEAWYFVGLLDGNHTVEQAMEAATEHLEDDAPGQSAVLRLMAQLHGAGLVQLVGDGADTDRLFATSEALRRRRILQQMRSPLAIRLPFFDPERVLQRMLPLARMIYSRLGFLIWFGIVIWAGWTAVLNFEPLTANFMDRVLSTENLILMTVVFAVMKLCHEFGHGLAVKRWGGEVHEMGVMFLVMIPIPYVDATAANEFPTRLRRIAVSAGGMYVEAFIAAIALLLWVQVEPGIVRATLYNAALIGSVSTLLFNLNPLLRFDGYYILSDLISIPNLGTRGTRYTQYLIQRYILWLDDASSPETEPSEKRWLFFYTIAAVMYRFVIITAIALAVAHQLFFIGILLALWAVAQFLLLPVIGGLKFLFLSPRVQKSRTGVVLRAGLAVGVIVGLILLVPAPRTTATFGVVWVPEDGEIIADTDGFVDTVLPAEGQLVRVGDPLIQSHNDALMAQKARLEARIRAMDAQYRSDFVTDRVALRLTSVELTQLREQLAAVEEDIDELTIRASSEGRFALAVAEDLKDRFVRRGDRLGFVIPPGLPTVRVAVSQQDIGLVRDSLRDIRLHSVSPEGGEIGAQLVRTVPAATDELPSMSLSTAGGGEIPVTTGEDGMPRAVQDLFHFELEPNDDTVAFDVGQKVHVKFVHDPEPVGFQVYRRFRQLFLRQFNV
ncbi:peptidase M50 [Pseudooceanicola sp. MF1-13]|uniref:peptidase M50 n=1 Tax=Pseudooceanicola sp. MF1-13 TaxID=3379095 RepID=UPI003891F77A